MLRFLGRTLVLISTLVLLAYPAHDARARQATDPSPSLKIGYLMDSLKVERWQTDLDTFQKRATELGATVLVETAEGDDDLQLQQANRLMDSGVRVLVLVAHDADKARRIVTAAKARHVHVLCYERLVRDSDVDFFVGTNSEVIGEMQASWLVRLAPAGNYVLIGGSPADMNAKSLRAGQMRVLQPFVDRQEIKIVADSWAKDWSPAEAYAAMSQAIDSAKLEAQEKVAVAITSTAAAD